MLIGQWLYRYGGSLPYTEGTVDFKELSLYPQMDLMETQMELHRMTSSHDGCIAGLTHYIAQGKNEFWHHTFCEQNRIE